MKILLALVAVVLANGTVTQAEYDATHPGWSRHRVQTTWDDRGTHEVTWFGEAGHMYIQRVYVLEEGGTVTAVYRDTKPTTDGYQVGWMRLTRLTEQKGTGE